MIAMDMLPLSFAERPGIEQFLRTVCPEYTKPSGSVIRNRLQGIYDVVWNKLISTLNNFPHISITTDGWSSRANHSFVTITAHGIDDQWNLRSFTLDTLEMSESHTARNTYNHLKEGLSSWNLYEKVIAVVHDNAPYIVAAIRDYWSNDSEIDVSVRCFCHSLQRVVERTLKNDVLSECLRKVSAVVGHFKHSNKASTALTSAQKKYRLPNHRLISHCPTRWNSAFAMIECVIEQREAITCVLLDKEVTTPESVKKLLLSNDDWDYIIDVKKILEPFDVTTRIMSSESQSTIAMVRPIVHSTLKKFLQPKDDDSGEIHLLKDILKEELRTRFLKTTSVALCGLACYLDPRYLLHSHLIRSQ
ncbi:E3 SUMO-protein ligase ZBED1-like [Cotesia glomerata]|uniref:E3 SUMO-protein ligase ZBED1-like n=1 Tax=Cotesia glomerata TaxID=32391 RepID=UPI001D02A12B|nr:E3 SUMO-protein ligase ZBED1-like [Cotesia glomerata]